MPKAKRGKQTLSTRLKTPEVDPETERTSSLRRRTKPEAKAAPKPKAQPKAKAKAKAKGKAKAQPEQEPAESEPGQSEQEEQEEQLEEEEHEVIGNPLDVEIHSVKSYRGTEGFNDLKQVAIEELEVLTFLTAIVRRPPNPSDDDPNQTSQPNQESQPAETEPEQPATASTSKGKGKGTGKEKGKGKSKGKGKAKTNKNTQETGKWEEGIASEDYHERARYWHFSRKPLKGEIGKNLSPQFEYIKRLKQGWRPPPGEKMGMPEDWFAEKTTVVLSSYKAWSSSDYDRDKVNLARIALYLGPINEHLERIATRNLIRRHLSTRLSQFILPDFCLKFRSSRPYKDMKNSMIEITPTLERFLEIVNFPMGEDNVELTTMMAFINIPVCWMVNTPTQRWLPPLAPDNYSQRVEFALVYNSVRPCEEEQVKFARKTEISYSSPAVLVAMKGPVQWPDFCRKYDQNPLYGVPEFQEFDDETKLEYCLEDLACAVQPSLDTLVIAWFLRCEQQVIPNRDHETKFPLYPPPEEYIFEDDDGNEIEGEEETETVDGFLSDADDREKIPERVEWLELPGWAWIPGILYDYNTCYLVAHIPLVPYLGSGNPVEYISYVFDEIPIDRPATPDENDTAILLERVRLGLAWMVLGKHAFKVTSLWESVIQPLQVMRHEELASLQDSKYGITERPASPKRHVVRRMRFESDTNAWMRAHNHDPDEDSVRAYQNLDMDEFLQMEPDNETSWSKRYEKDVAYMKKQATPRVEKWQKGIKEPEEDYFEGILLDNGEFVAIRGI